MNDDLTFRETLNPPDTEHVRAIVQSTGFFSPAEVEIAVELAIERLVKGLDSGYHFLFAEQNNRVVGYSCFGPIPGAQASIDLYWIAVHNDFRGAGIGKKLMVESERAIKRMGGRRIYVETSSRAQYQPTRAFYLACGYKQEALLEDFYAPGDSKVIYVKVIN
jgi:ribosomal protein S18 acetylase RimI-like enzyme